MIGLRIGAAIGSAVTIAVGVDKDGVRGNTASMAGVTKDATSLIYCPNTATEWTTTMAAAGIGGAGPSDLWRCQEASGNLGDSIGSISLAVNGAPAYAQTLFGWTRKALKLTDASSQSFSSASTSLPDISVTSALMLTWWLAPSAAPSSNRQVGAMGANASTRTLASILTTGKLQINTNGNTATAVNNTVDGLVHPLVMKVDRTNSRCAMYSDVDKMVPTFSAGTTGKGLLLGTVTALLAAPEGYLYAALFTGSAAEMTDAQVKKLLQTLGWTITWS